MLSLQGRSPDNNWGASIGMWSGLQTGAKIVAGPLWGLGGDGFCRNDKNDIIPEYNMLFFYRIQEKTKDTSSVAANEAEHIE